MAMAMAIAIDNVNGDGHHRHHGQNDDYLVKSDPLLLQSPPLWHPITLARLKEPV